MLENNEENVDKTEKKVTEVASEIVKVEVKEVKEKVDDTTDAVEEIEKSIAVDAEKDTAKEEESAVVDYTKLSLEELVAELKKTISNNPVQKIKNQVDGIKTAFNQKFGALLAEKKAAFLEEGGNSIDFQFSSPLKSDYNSLLSEYKKQRDAHYNDLEKQLSANLNKRLAVIEQLKDLIENADTATMYKSFRELQDTWRTIGPVSKNHYNDTWKTFHHHVERFYDLLHLSNDFRDLDFKHNLEEKLKIIEKANALAEEADINVAFKELQDLHKIWKEDIGPVSQEMREDIWQKFSAATKKIHDRRHDHFREMRSKYQEIIEKKLVVVEKLNAYDTANNKTHNDWQKSIKDIEALRQEYFNAGKLPYSKSEEVWQKFKAATKKFNSAKNVFYKQEKNDQQENLKKKMELIELAESLKESDDWESSTNTLKKIQADWKKIGHVPRKFSDDIWKRFKAACNHYFDRYHDQKNSLNKEQQEVVDAKKAFLETVKELTTPTKDEIFEIINNWRNLGVLPRNARHIDGKFNKLIDRALNGLDLDKNEVAMLKFTHVVDGLAADNDVRKLDSEQMFVRKKIDEVVKEIQQLENNLGFFSNAKDDNPLVLNVRNRVNEFKEDLALWKEKLSYIKSLDY
ncbi:DUF349 domain-containing protein [Polaribacter butkevichii]|uniref:Chromosome segregation protein n=1 Tax=Polaribacter butkevichii TaxID=218490 RepID=A0A2P6CFK2_9FLAO|nr:DUF349 domain-containing protein [Polaribacter butkevichii]PQJ73690.1 chromosome segregation protein [Polaribacter butkevichii]